MADTRRRNVNWTISSNADGTLPITSATLATLMDIRDELQRLNGLLQCRNFINIPRKLDAIRRNTTKKCKARK